MEFKTAADALEDRQSIVTLTTGSVEIDKLLEGGIETGSITEVVSYSSWRYSRYGARDRDRSRLHCGYIFLLIALTSCSALL